MMRSKDETNETYIAIIIGTHRVISLCGQKKSSHTEMTQTQKKKLFSSKQKETRFHKPGVNTTMKATDEQVRLSM